MIGNELLAIIEIISLRQGLPPEQMVAPNDLPVDQVLVNTANEVKTVVETKMAAALEKIRTQTTRYKLEKARAEAEIAEIARMEIVNARAVQDPQAPPAAPLTHINRITRFQPTDIRHHGPGRFIRTILYKQGQGFGI